MARLKLGDRKCLLPVIKQKVVDVTKYTSLRTTGERGPSRGLPKERRVKGPGYRRRSTERAIHYVRLFPGYVSLRFPVHEIEFTEQRGQMK